MKALSPGQSLLFLILLGIAVSGWVYGFHWKKTATGAQFTGSERLIIELQDQIGTLSEQNDYLTRRVAELEEGRPDTSPATAAPTGER